MITIHKTADLSILKFIAENAREADRIEAYHLAGGRIPKERALLESALSSYASSHTLWHLQTHDGTPFFILGLIYTASEEDTVWAMATREIETIGTGRAFIKKCKEDKMMFLSLTKRCSNYVWAGNKTAVKWLKLVGAVIISETIINGETFYYFRFLNGNNNSLLFEGAI